MNKEKDHIITLMHQYLTGTLDAAGRQELRFWLNNSEQNRQLFQYLTDTHNLSEKYTANKSINREKAFRRVAQRTGIRRNFFLQTLRYAAVALLAVGAGWFVLEYDRTEPVPAITFADIRPGEAKATLLLADGQAISLPENGEHDIPIEPGMQIRNKANRLIYSGIRNKRAATPYNTLQTPRGGEYTVVLADSTVVQLNSASRLKYPVAFNEAKREVYLSGEAFFEVKKMPDKPFYVITDSLRIRVYGTSFNVNTLDDGCIRTALVEGALGITAGKQTGEYRLHPSQLGVFHRGNSLFQVSTVDLTPYTAWKDGYFVFENQTLEQIMHTLSRWYNVDFACENEALRQLHFTGHMKRYEQITTILEAIETAVNVRFFMKDGTICLS